jgi:hypothetical protein
MARDRRIRTIPMAIVPGRPKLTIADSEWREIENAYGRELPARVRRLVIGATTTFVHWDGVEQSAELLLVAIERAKAIKEATMALRDMLGLVLKTESQVWCDHLIKKHLDGLSPQNRKQTLELARRERSRKERSEISDQEIFRYALSGRANQKRGSIAGIVDVLTSLSLACGQALQDMHHPRLRGYRGGEAWDQWIRDLTKIMRDHELPVGVSKGEDRSTEESPFVLLVVALQNCECVPHKAHRHHLDFRKGKRKHALAQAILRARKKPLLIS